MPHVIVKLWPGKTEEQKSRLAEKIVKDIIEVFHSKEASISVSMEEVNPDDWNEQVYKPDIESKRDSLYKQPGY